MDLEYVPEEAIELAGWRSMWDHSIIGIALVDQDGTFVRANPGFCRLTEYTETELKTRRYQDITHPSDRDFDEESAREVFEGKRDSYDMTKRYITKSERVVWVLLRVVPIRVDGRFMYFLAQASELIELSPPKLPKSYPSTSATFPVGPLLWRWLKNNWQLLGFVAASIGVIVSETLKRMSG